jgi:DNA-binding NarL/FixJ family response regulator
MVRSSTEEIVRKREAPCLVILDDAYRIVSAAENITSFFASVGCEQTSRDRLPAELEAAAANLARHGRENALAFPLPGVSMRANVLRGSLGRAIAVTLERVRARRPLQSAAERFGLSEREVQVLELIMSGHDARSIARTLHIAESTVGEYFKHLYVKISAKNRADMVARVLEWSNA